ncbi:hypothetical protein P154DRAFT_579675 [Amniculicola lignicola CBS 123094]|uniref:Uncharacterized protein n=1 Tax=Amniculicola lignicola CBS 123094 TaxID=1392246 RepID=A0A6A5W6M8_9PLEO|nr:hypothetical protein P154DRAFT_579675 [Amniculicola lignicola CBS 123094]
MSINPSIDVSETTHTPPDMTGSSNDLEVGNKARSQADKAVIQVIDAPYDGSKPTDLVSFSFSDNIAEGMKSLPPLKPDTARILDVTVHSDFIITGLRATKGPETTKSARKVLIKYLQDTYAQTVEERRVFRWLSDPLLVNDIGSISSQWSQQMGRGSTNLYRLVNRTSLQQHPLDFDVYPRDSYLTCAQDANGGLIVIIVNDVWSKQTFRQNKSGDAHISFQNPRSTSRMLARTSWTSMSDGTLDTFAKLLVLDFFLASIYLQPVDYYGPLIYPQLSKKDVVKFSLSKNPHLQVPLGLFEPRLSAKSREAFKEIEDAEGILRSVNNLVDSILFVIEALRQKPNNDQEKRIRELEGLCSERRNNAQRALEALNRQLDYLSKRHAIREAKAIKILTILASLYLPLSLSATLLGMQTPFKKVAHTIRPNDPILKVSQQVGTNLLFDFFGVFVGLSSATIFIIHFIRLILWLKANGIGLLSKTFSGPFTIFHYGKKWRYGGRGGQIFDIIRIFTTWWLGAGFLITLLTIFMVGMLRTAQNAWDTAKWMFATYCVVGGVLVGCYVGIYWSLYHKRLRVR